jgi:hypothetical protein
MFDWKKQIGAHLAGLNLAPTRESEIVEELSQHLEDRFEELLAKGIPEEEARRSVLEELKGGNLLAQELQRLERPIRREPVELGAEKGNRLEGFYRDIGYGSRMLRKSSGFTVVAVLTLALGIGANTFIFSVMNKFLVRPLPVDEPARVVSLNNGPRKGQGSPVFSYANYRDLRDHSDVTTGLLAYEPVPASLNSDGINERVWGYLVSGNYFSVLGAQPALGRLILPEDDREVGAHPVAVISHRCWQQRFGGDPRLVGRGVLINGRTFTIIGVAPPDFVGLELSYVPEIWFPMMMQNEFRPLMPGPAKGSKAWLEDRKVMSVWIAGRLKPRVTVAQAEAALNAVASQLARDYPDEDQEMSITLSRPGVWGGMGRNCRIGFALGLHQFGQSAVGAGSGPA